MNYYLFSLCLILLCSIVKTSPVGHDGTEDDNLESRRSEDVTTTHPTFTVQRLDAPIERIEIRLIDDNTTHSAPEVTVSPVREVERVKAENDGNQELVSTEQTAELVHEPDQHPSPAPTEPLTANDDMYKKVEYVVQPTSNELTPTTDRSSEPIVVGEDPSYYSTTPSDQQASAEAKAWISVSTTVPKFEGDIDEDDLPPPPATEDTENEEPEEECLANKEKLSDEVIEKLQAETTMYYRLVRQRNEQQKEYCGGGEARDTSSDMFRRCSNWRAEKLVYYYKLMRKTYCQVDNWPNSPKIKKTYGEYLNLFGTFYAFQK
ncbi:uncharacterized protein CELE_T10G3.1 [Caenorhabditis elegans]|uniref:Secreted protein n=1 Tax=Caenorhabditis elegans TaxID=6239 RepID=P92018_CAEEL|nr:Secreted protein [Caenorhabditis elegans]CAB03324.2 Secreted protein [Caenorhabditis elegans]|eukprot:NP_506343.2 Uncharacterized protein CELE_T10G3.1 [Caenorhabditis elegans]